MASTLSPSAIHRIIFLFENDDRPGSEKKDRLAYYGHYALPLPSRYPHVLQHVNSKWRAVHELFTDIKPALPLDYLHSPELALVLKGCGRVDDEDFRAMFAYEKPLKFWGCPWPFVSKIIEAFMELQDKPEYLDVTITALYDLGATRPSEAWSEVYRTHLPCYACSTVKTIEGRSMPRLRYLGWEGPVGNVDVAVEKFHISSQSLDKQLTVEVHYPLEQGTSEGEREHYSKIHKITVRLDNLTCSAQCRLPGPANRSSAPRILIPDLASEVFGFLERAHVGSSLLANSGLHDIISQLKQSLPVHHLTCVFQQEVNFDYERLYTGFYWLVMRHIQRDLSYTAERRFKIPPIAGAESDCDLIRRYLSNSHVANLGATKIDFPFAIKMLANLASRNFSVGRMQIRSEAEQLSDYHSMDAVFGGLRMSDLYLSCDEHRFVELVKTTDFFRMVQRLRTLKLDLEKQKPIGHARRKSPLWVSGIYLLRNCEYYRVDYRSNHDSRSLERRIVRICEEFVRGEITDIVEHFQLKSYASQGMNYAFSRDNLVVSGMKVEGKHWDDRINDIEWDVYRFRNASTSEYLTACVGKDKEDDLAECFLHIVKGEVYPEASFADYW